MNDMTDIQAEPAAALDPVCGFVLGLRADDIPVEVKDRAALLLLDTIGVCAASAPMRAGVLGRQAALRLQGREEPPTKAPAPAPPAVRMRRCSTNRSRHPLRLCRTRFAR